MNTLELAERLSYSVQVESEALVNALQKLDMSEAPVRKLVTDTEMHIAEALLAVRVFQETAKRKALETV